MSPARDRWPRLAPGEARRLRALVVIGLVTVAPAALAPPLGAEVGAPRAPCPQGVVRVAGDLACAGPGVVGPAVTGRAAWWLGQPLDLNRARVEDLTLVDGVGPKLAARIVADRAARGRFGSVAEVRRVKGVGAVLGARIAAVAEVRPATSAPPR